MLSWGSPGAAAHAVINSLDMCSARRWLKYAKQSLGGRELLLPVMRLCPPLLASLGNDSMMVQLPM